MKPRNLSSDPLARIAIASPCTQSWDRMVGDDRKRFCEECNLHVYDFSRLPRAEIEALLQDGGRVCARLYRRADGTVLTQDCPVGLRQRLRRARVRAVAMLAALLPLGFACKRETMGRLPSPPVGVDGSPSMGDVALPPAPPAPPATPTTPPTPQMGEVQAPPPPRQTLQPLMGKTVMLPEPPASSERPPH